MEFLLCLIAAVMQELLHWIDVRQEVDQEVNIIGSFTYWLISISFVTSFSLLSFFISNSLESSDLWLFMLLAMIMPEFGRKLIKIVLGWIYPVKEVLMVRKTTRFKASDYFMNS